MVKDGSRWLGVVACIAASGCGPLHMKFPATELAVQSTTLRLWPGCAPGDVPGPPGLIGIGKEPGPSPEELGYPPSAWINLVEFRTFPLGFKIQAPLAPVIPARWKSLEIGNWVRLASPAWGPQWATTIVDHPVRADATWESLFVRSDGWTGADGAATVALPGDRVLWLFGDSFIGPVVNGGHGPGTVMVNNTVAVGRREAGPLEFAWGSSGGKAVAWALPAGADEGKTWFWPASGGVIARGSDGVDRLVLFMCRLGHRDESNSMWNFEARGTSLVVVENPAAPLGAWRTRTVDVAPLADSKGRQVVWGGSVLDAGRGEVYVCGVDGTNVLDKKMLVARAPAASLDRFDTWRFWDGTRWAGQAGAAAAVTSPVASELSVHRLSIGGREKYVMVYSELTLGPRVLCRSAERIEGPWTEPVTLYECPEPREDARMMVYSAKAHPELSRPGELLVSYCVNSTGFADVLKHAEKYRPRFVRVPTAMVP